MHYPDPCRLRCDHPLLPRRGHAAGAKRSSRPWLATAICLVAFLASNPATGNEKVEEISVVGRTWTGHFTAPPILAGRDGRQYVAYYNEERRLTLAWRKIAEKTWRSRAFPVVTRWATGAHAQIGLTVDARGHIHLVPYRRDLSEAPPAPPNIIYFRSERPHDPESMVPTFMVAPTEPNPSYPLFLNDHRDDLYFVFRAGGSGSGTQVLNALDAESGRWKKLTALQDGRGEMSAYGTPVIGPDGHWHCLWMWRDTPNAATNHSISYMASEDLRVWKDAAGNRIEMPVTIHESRVIIDPRKPGDGLINPLQELGWDSRNRPLVSYHAYTPDGKSAVYLARPGRSGWDIALSHAFDFRWHFGGGGAVGLEFKLSPAEVLAPGKIVQRISSKRAGKFEIISNESDLRTLEVRPGHGSLPAWKQEHGRVTNGEGKSGFSVHWIPERGRSSGPGRRSFLRWEAGPVNPGDKPVPPPYPEPSVLQVFTLGGNGNSGGENPR